MELNKYLKKRLEALSSKKEEFEPQWEKIGELCYVNANIYKKDRDNRIRQKVFDTTARNALTYFTASMKSILTPTTSQWHRLKSSNVLLEQDDEAQAYLQYATDLLFKVRYSARSTFASEVDMFLTQVGLFGVGVMFIEEDIGRGINYKTIPIDEVYLDENEKGIVDTVYRKFNLTARQAFETYGEACSEKIKKCLGNNREDEIFEFLHAVEPRRNRSPLGKTAKNMPIASYHLELGEKKIVKESGYTTMPYAVCHYLKLPHSPYGDSPALQSFYDILTANEMAKTILRTGQLQANPPILTSNGLIDSSKLGSAGAIVRGGLDSQGRPAAVSMQYGNNLTVTLEMQQAVRAAIEKAFLVPLFQALTQTKEMTATEVEKREVEKAMLLAPMCERMASEWLNAMISREVDILSKYGYLDNVPEVLTAEGSISVEYQSPYIRMQDSDKILGLYKTIESTLTMAQSDPGVLDILDMPEAIRQIASYYNVDTSCLRSREEVQKLGQARATAQEAQQMLGAGESLTKSMKNIGLGGEILGIQ